MWRSPLLRNSFHIQRGSFLARSTSATSNTRRFSNNSSSSKWASSETQDLAKPASGLEIEDGGKKSFQNVSSEIRHLLRTREISSDTQEMLLRERMVELIDLDIDQSNPDKYFKTLDAAAAQMYRRKGQWNHALPLEKVFELLQKTARFFLESNRTDYPHYMGKLTKMLMRSGINLPTTMLLDITEIASKANVGGFSASLAYVLSQLTQTVGPEFTGSLLQFHASKSKVSLDTYESILQANEVHPRHVLVNDDFVNSFVAHIQEIYADSNPRVHEYLDSNRDLSRVQALANDTINSYMEHGSIEHLLRLLKLKRDLNSVRASAVDMNVIESIITHLQIHGKQDDFHEIKQVLLSQNIDDEDLVEALLREVAMSPSQHECILSSISEFVVKDEIRFSSAQRLQASMIQLSMTQKSNDWKDVFSDVKNIYDPYLHESESASTFLTITLQALSSFHVDGLHELMDSVCQDILQQTNVEPSIYDYKAMIDGAIALNDGELSFSMFEESINTSFVHWAESMDPSVAATLDKLAILCASSNEGIVYFFPKIRKIKQHMPASFSADALTVLVTKMLQEACVGDVIELLKRELPNIEKDSYQKLRVDLPYAASYQMLFRELLKFVVTYKEDASYETNWVLYGELHKYFHIPLKSYLPAIRFFCEADRLNAALLIVRRMKMLSELHAKSNINMPPTRAIYTYLLEVFGEKLYEEGVVEIHEFLKMDTSLQTQDIGLQNAILNAYSNLQHIGKARDLFLSIASNSKQHGGINEETAKIMLKTYTYKGLPYVQKFWNSLTQYGIYPDHAIFKQYLIAHSYHGSIQEAIKLVEEIDDFNLEFSSDLLSSMHNYCLEPEKQKEIANWASENHAGLWDELVKGGDLQSATPYLSDTNLITSGPGA